MIIGDRTHFSEEINVWYERNQFQTAHLPASILRLFFLLLCTLTLSFMDA